MGLAEDGFWVVDNVQWVGSLGGATGVSLVFFYNDILLVLSSVLEKHSNSPPSTPASDTVKCPYTTRTRKNDVLVPIRNVPPQAKAIRPNQCTGHVPTDT